MRKCPSCNSKIPWITLRKVSRITPIACEKCNKLITVEHPSQLILGFICILPMLILGLLDSRDILDVPSQIFYFLLGMIGVIVYFKKVRLICL